MQARVAQGAVEAGGSGAVRRRCAEGAEACGGDDLRGATAGSTLLVTVRIEGLGGSCLAVHRLFAQDANGALIAWSSQPCDG